MRALFCVGPHGVRVWNVANGMFVLRLFGQCGAFIFCLRLTIRTDAHPYTFLILSHPIRQTRCALFFTLFSRYVKN